MKIVALKQQIQVFFFELSEFFPNVLSLDNGNGKT